jgi:aspartyl protease family protein
MRSILVFAAILFVGGGILARYAEQEIATRPQSQSQANLARSADRQRSATSSNNSSRTVILSGDRGGHFRTDADVDGRRLNFVVDTGASLVVLRESDAARVGIRPSQRDYNSRVSTANGDIKATKARLNRVEIGDITVYDVSALVLPDEALGQNLLGASFLSRLRRYEYANGRMILEQ